MNGETKLLRHLSMEVVGQRKIGSCETLLFMGGGNFDTDNKLIDAGMGAAAISSMSSL